MTYQYDYSTGNLVQSVDQNSQTTTYAYADPLNRITSVTGPPSTQNGGQQPQIKYAYVDGNGATVTVTNAKGGTSVSELDGMGRAIKTSVEFSSGVLQNTTVSYNGMGLVQSTANPYFTLGDPSYGVTSSFYDALGRKVLQLQPDNVTTSQTVNGATTTSNSSAQSWIYTGNVVAFTDENGNQWTRTSDGLGRLATVAEPGGLQTAYGYDVLNNLLTVTQSGASSDTARKRSFSYDSMSRLTCASNPENSASACPASAGSATLYSYDVNGNVSTKSSPSQDVKWGSTSATTTSYTYDSLNRMLSKNSSGFLSSCFLYDGGAPNGIGRLASEWTQAGSCPTTLPSTGFFSLLSVTAYDPVGRITSEQQCTPGSCTANTGPQQWYGYDIAGNLTCSVNSAGVPSGTSVSVGSPSCLTGSVGTPNGLLFTANFDPASHLTGLVSNWSALPSTLYSLQTSNPYGYGPVGPNYWSAGTGLSMAESYTNRLRVNSFGVTSTTP